MKKIIWIIVILLIVAVGYGIWQKGNTASTTPPDQTTINNKTFVSADQSITFNYPSTLSASQKNNIITLNHQINFVNTDACDFKGDAKPSPTLVDFHVTIQMFNMTVASTSQIINPYLSPENINGDTLRINPGFIDTYNNGPWNGYVMVEGVEGCGQLTYYLPLSSSRTLVIQKMLIGALSDIADPVNKQKILATPGAISPDQSNVLFNTIVQSLQVR